MAINVIWNKLYGLGGSTQHLHGIENSLYGDEIASTWNNKDFAVARRLFAVKERKSLNANKNFANDNKASRRVSSLSRVACVARVACA